MGLINHDVYECSNGAQNTGTYISFATETLYVSQGNTSQFPTTVPYYNVRANYRVYWDEECRMMGKSFIDLKSVNAVITAEQLNGNVYSSLYASLKSQYPNTTDVFDLPPVSPTGASGASGASGPSGESGASGASGESGASGPSGPSV